MAPAIEYGLVQGAAAVLGAGRGLLALVAATRPSRIAGAGARPAGEALREIAGRGAGGASLEGWLEVEDAGRYLPCPVAGATLAEESAGQWRTAEADAMIERMVADGDRAIHLHGAGKAKGVEAQAEPPRRMPELGRIVRPRTRGAEGGAGPQPRSRAGAQGGGKEGRDGRQTQGGVPSGPAGGIL